VREVNPAGETIWTGWRAEKIQNHCSRTSMDSQSQYEALMLRIVPAHSEETVAQARILFREYATTTGVEVCLVDYERELASLPGLYAPPSGRLLLAIKESAGSAKEPIGCAALRQFEPGACELKRLYVRHAFRGQGAGRELVRDLIAEARSIGYRRMLLDTLPSMQEAHKIYRALGFREIPAYQKNPIPGSLFFELFLD
jgi:GNAT superfamily N-acetyltransferase